MNRRQVLRPAAAGACLLAVTWLTGCSSDGPGSPGVEPTQGATASKGIESAPPEPIPVKPTKLKGWAEVWMVVENVRATIRDGATDPDEIRTIVESSVDLPDGVQLRVDGEDLLEVCVTGAQSTYAAAVLEPGSAAAPLMAVGVGDCDPRSGDVTVVDDAVVTGQDVLYAINTAVAEATAEQVPSS